MSTTLLFVYGTLKRGQRNHGLIRDQRYFGVAETAAKYRLFDLGSHPGLVRDETNAVAVRGELWVVSACVLAELDDFEKVPNLFVRAAIDIADWENVEAYFWNRAVPQDAKTGSEWPFPS